MVRYGLLTGCLLLACGYDVAAQRADTTHALARWDSGVARSLSLRSGNDALLLADSLPDAGYARFDGQVLGGGLRRPQDPRSAQVVAFGTERYQHAGTWLLHGRFMYQHERQRDRRWTAMMDPFSGTPFVLADSTIGDWKKHHFALEAGVSVPISKGLNAGFAVDYRLGSGAKNRDPRPLSNVNDITLRPSVSLAVGAHHIVGAHVQYRSVKEDISVMIRAPFVQGIYRLKGLSFHDQILPVSSGYTRLYRATAMGGGLQHLYRVNGAMQWLSELGYAGHRESTQDGTMPPRSSGDFRNDRFSGSSTLRYSRGRMEHTVSLEAEAYRTIGREYHYVSGALVFEGDMYREEQRAAALGYEWMRHHGGVPYRWYVSPTVHYRDFRATYPTTPAISQQAFGQVMVSVEGGSWLSRRLSINADIGYREAISEALAYHGESANIAHALLVPDQDYQTASILAYGLGMRYVFVPGRPVVRARNFFVGLTGRAWHRLSEPNDLGYGRNRGELKVQVGMYY